jgi:hypothetical protein
MKQQLLCLLAALLLVPAACFGDKLSEVVDSVGRRDERLQASFLHFPMFSLATNAPVKLDFQTLALTNPVIIDGINFYGFRFKVPKRKVQEDLVWAFGAPSERHFWYIIPETGDMAGFEEFFRERRASYEGLAALFPNPSKGKEMVIQRLSGDSLEDDKCYLIWFAFGSQKPARISVAFTFADLGPKKVHNRGALEKALGLHRK